MGLDSKQLLLDKFIATNQDVYKDRPSAVERLGEVTVDNTQVTTIHVDPDDETKRIARLSSVDLAIEAIDQSWECATLLGPVVINFTVQDTIADLATLLAINAKGIYRYNDGGTTKVAQIVQTNFTDYQGVLNEAVNQLSIASNYTLTTDNISLVSVDPNGWLVKIVSDYISGEMLLIRFDESKIIKGNWALGYLGQVTGSEIITTGSLASLVGLGTANTITPDGIWLKFSYFGSIIYIAQKTVVNNLSYVNLLNAGVINNSKIATIGKDRFYIGTPRGIGGLSLNEWEDLIYRVHRDDPTNTHWEVFSNTDMNIGLGTDGNALVGNQTIVSDTDGTYHTRGATGLVSSNTIDRDTRNTSTAWRPTLTLIGVKQLTSFNVINLELGHPVPVINHDSLIAGVVRKMLNVKITVNPRKVSTMPYSLNNLVKVIRFTGSIIPNTVPQIVLGISNGIKTSQVIRNISLKVLTQRPMMVVSALTHLIYGVKLSHIIHKDNLNRPTVNPSILKMTSNMSAIKISKIGSGPAPILKPSSFNLVGVIRKPILTSKPVPLSLLY